MLRIENETLQVTIAPQGAELQSIIRKDLSQEYLWSGDPAFWGKKSPVLFPIVGGLKKNQYQHALQTYQLSRHGFAREMAFEVVQQDAASITLSISSNEETLQKYPFHFSFSINYQLEENSLHVTYDVQNTGTENLLFSVGGHPAFKVPLAAGTGFEDYYLEFNATENAGIWPLSAEGLIESTPVPFLQNTNTLPLKKELFFKDALVFKQLKSTAISLKSHQTPHGLQVQFKGFPFMGIWAAKNADFVCIEPWCGIADGVYASGNLLEKEGINSLNPSTSFNRTWTVTLF
jgi:galactose mutarotase-like enzyme